MALASAVPSQNCFGSKGLASRLFKRVGLKHLSRTWPKTSARSTWSVGQAVLRISLNRVPPVRQIQLDKLCGTSTRDPYGMVSIAGGDWTVGHSAHKVNAE